MLFWIPRLLVAWVALLLAGTAIAKDGGRVSAHSILGTGRGLDHVGILVANLAEAGTLFSKRLGFTIDAGGKLPFGTENATIDFADETFLELIAISDRATALQRKPGLVRFLDRGEGAPFAVMEVASAQQSFEALTRRGHRLNPPNHVTMSYPGVAESAPGWTSLFFARPPLAGDPLFFIEYDPWREFQERHPEFKPDTRHSNGATKLRSAWLAVTNAEMAADTMRRMGFATRGRVLLPSLEARGCIVRAGKGDLVLLSSVHNRGPVATFLSRHEGGIVGVTIEVRDLRATREFLQLSLGAAPRRVRGPFGEAILLEPEATHGIWIEFVGMDAP